MNRLDQLARHVRDNGAVVISYHPDTDEYVVDTEWGKQADELGGQRVADATSFDLAIALDATTAGAR